MKPFYHVNTEGRLVRGMPTPEPRMILVTLYHRMPDGTLASEAIYRSEEEHARIVAAEIVDKIISADPELTQPLDTIPDDESGSPDAAS